MYIYGPGSWVGAPPLPPPWYGLAACPRTGPGEAVLAWGPPRCTALHLCTFAPLHCTPLHCIALQCNAVQCNALHCNAVQCNAMQ